MKLTWYVPVYEWGEDPSNVHNNKVGTAMYRTTQDLYSLEPNAIGHFEVEGVVPTKAQFEGLTECGAW